MLFVMFSTKKKKTAFLMNTLHQSQVSESLPRPRANFFAETPLAQAAAVAPKMTPASPSRQLRVTCPTAKLIDSNNSRISWPIHR